MEEYKYDSIVLSTIEEIKLRAQKGKIKYGTDLDRKDLIDIDYLQHLKEELLDGILYLNKFIKMYNDKNELNTK